MSTSVKAAAPRRRSISRSMAAQRATKCDQGRSMYVNSDSGSSTTSRDSGGALPGAVVQVLAPPRTPTLRAAAAGTTAWPRAAAAMVTEFGTERAARVLRSWPPGRCGFVEVKGAAPRMSSAVEAKETSGAAAEGDMLAAAICKALATAGPASRGPEARGTAGAATTAAAVPGTPEAAAAPATAAPGCFRSAFTASRVPRSAPRSAPAGSRSSLGEASTKPQLSRSFTATPVSSSRLTRR
mmetsp:Transcript_12686/g.39718  ORF Transcript_12686/g.39718 Transcript_12686/m.39718 type:complete len:240 (-) Transcript_12686:235-954(-)